MTLQTLILSVRTPRDRRLPLLGKFLAKGQSRNFKKAEAVLASLMSELDSDTARIHQELNLFSVPPDDYMRPNRHADPQPAEEDKSESLSRQLKRRYFTLYIPASFVARVHARLSRGTR